ncbi:DNA repair ATPase [Akkermansiaceae bacterium]|nr:DNA repair ATPase [Akkermansiaceae bacterium]
MSEEKSQQLEGGAYEVIRARLEKGSTELQARMGRLNEQRQEVFGSVETALVSTERVSTEHSCVPRDIIAIGHNRFLFGYNIQFGLKTTTSIEDVFNVYDYDQESHTFSPVPVEEVLSDPAFLDDFKYLYKYYRQAVFLKFMVIGPNLYMGLRIGKTIADLKAFKWLMKGDGTLGYIGNRFDHEYQFPPQQEFEWKRAHRDMQRPGEHPHVSIEDRVFVETVGGDLTIKVEDNTETGSGIYEEPVTEADQTLDDAEIVYAVVGSLILLKILPYREELYRYLVFNEKTQTVHRVDAIGHSCVLLPDEQGIIFSNGYLLLTGESKVFETDLTDMRFERRIASANGEDTLFVFYNRKSGDYVLLSYNMISQSVDTPVVCNGYSLFPDGRMILFRTEEEAQKHHALQIWQTSYLSDEVASSQASNNESYLFKIGNAELVRGMAECREVLTLLRKDDNYGDLYLDLSKKAGDIIDSYFWLGQENAGNLAEPLKDIRGAATSAIDEFEKVQGLRRSTKERTGSVREVVEVLLKSVRHSPPDDIFGFVHHLSELRKRRGEVIGLRDLRYVDAALVDDLEKEVATAADDTAAKTVAFLLKPESLNPYREAVESQQAKLPKLAKVIDADEVAEALDQSGTELEMLIDVVGNLKIEDATQTTAIIDSVSGIYSILNGVRAELKNKRKDLAKGEGVAQFGAQMKLLGQSVVNYLDLCDSPEKCEEYLTKVMVQLEELEGKFAEFDEYIEELSAKREEIYEAFEGRKQSLLEKRSRRTNQLVKSAERILSGIKHRLEGFSEINEINGYFAGDLMIEKVRDIIAELTEAGDAVKGDDIQTRLKTTRDDAVRALKDRKELFVDGQAIIKFGKHRFSVNEQDLELSIVPREGEMCFHLSGTNFFEEIKEESFLSTSAVWDQEVISETKEVYRAEYLAYKFLKSGEEDLNAFMQPRYSEGYLKGVHDLDAAKIVEVLKPMHDEAGLLRYSPRTRAKALLAWEEWDEEKKAVFRGRLLAHGQRKKFFGDDDTAETWVGLLMVEMEDDEDVHLTEEEREYLYHELTGDETFVVSREAADIYKHFKSELTAKRADKAFASVLEPFQDSISGRFGVILDWFMALSTEDAIYEAAFWLAKGGYEERWVQTVELTAEIEGLKGSHRLVEEGKLSLHYHEFMDRLAAFEQSEVPTFQAYVETKQTLVEDKREEMRLDEFKPRVMSAFVRNRLINEVYLPMVGDNLAKQMGTAGGDTRTDRMGLLLLISPPGYGKTTLMEYIGNRLGLTFMKINGPALGHEVTSLDPADAPNASAREEICKLNLALEMGDNVMIYLDDIQHTHSEFLQKFISLCDGQRKIEGVYKGKARTYDLRGKKVAVVMAGNPYTETGGKFQIPDMLANRADTYNLGDILGDHEDAFKYSFIENCLTSNSVLSKLASKSQKDVYAAMAIAETGSQEGVDFEGNYTPAEIEEFSKTLKHLFRIRDTILRVNLEYIDSAAQEDAYRVEPSFKLQGSYRNMNRIAEKVIPLMTPEEVEGLIFDHYQNESQTLTTGAEANLLKFRELEGVLTGEEQARWDQIKKDFGKQKLLGGAGENDPVARVVAQMTQFNDGLEAISTGLTRPQNLAEASIEQLQKIIEGLRAVPVKVDINVVPVQDEGDSIESIEKRSSPPIDIVPEVSQGD